jgi:hypothetical protein
MDDINVRGVNVILNFVIFLGHSEVIRSLSCAKPQPYIGRDPAG